MNLFDEDDYEPNFFGSFECHFCGGDNESGEYDPRTATLLIVCTYCGEEFTLEDFLA